MIVDYGILRKPENASIETKQAVNFVRDDIYRVLRT